MLLSRWQWKKGLPIMAVLLAETSQAIETIQQTYCSNQNTGMQFDEVHEQYGSLDSCQNICKYDYAFAIIQGPDCWCSNYAPANQEDISLCNTVCPGWPYETCGSTANDLFGYVALTKSAWGTMTASTAAAATSTPAQIATSTPQQAASSSPAAPVGTTIILTSEHIIVSTKAIISTQVNTVAASTSLQAVTIYQTLTATEQVTVVQVPSTTSTSSPRTPSPSSTSTSTTTYEQYITVSGAIITQYITAVASQAAQSSSPAIINESHASRGLSGGAAAGIAIGAIIGAGILGALFFFCCWRKRSRDGDDESGLNRNTSVLSKVGLLRGTSGKSGARGPKLQTVGLGGSGENPMSATTAMTTTTSRDSRPMFVDQRLNPNAWGMQHPNTSQSTLGSLHDHRDYSRPLEVRNPDSRIP